LETYAIHVSGDSSHATRAAHSIELPSAAAFMSIDALLKIVKKYQIDAIHPGYGFLSESAEFSKRMWHEASAVVVGPGWSILDNTGDKLKARQLAQRCEVHNVLGSQFCYLQPTQATFLSRQPYTIQRIAQMMWAVLPQLLAFPLWSKLLMEVAAEVFG
jgi:pyruvate carboxylase